MADDSIQELKQRLDEMEKRLKITEDIEQIKQLHGRYQDAHVFGDVTGEVACFAEDGILDVDDQKRTKPEIVEFLSQPKSDRPVLKEAGIAAHPQIKVEGDKATGHWVNYNLFSYADTKQLLFWMQAFEDAEYKRENGEWKISYIRWVKRLTIGNPGEVPGGAPSPSGGEGG